MRNLAPVKETVLKLTRHSLILIAFISIVIPLFPAKPDNDYRHTSFRFDGFNGTNITLEADDLLIRFKSAIALTNCSRFRFGRVRSSTPVQRKSNETISSFSTTFVFSIVPLHSEAGGKGISFIVSPYSDDKLYNPFFAVEFDNDRNHVGMDINGLISVQIRESAGYWNGEDFHGFSLKSGRNIQAWIDYDHLQSQINVTITLAGLPRPQKPLISHKINLQNVLQQEMFRKRMNSHEHPSRGLIAGVTLATLVLFALVMVAPFFVKRAKHSETNEEWEQEFWPHRFTHSELNIATNGFRDENVLGEGGFGRIYKGVLPGSGQEVAVKCMTKEFTEGMKAFVAEISTMGRVQHRNLVQLRGWCRRHKQLFIVYDHMPNGSLDKLIFGNPTTVLPWPRRYAIVKGVAAGLLYLHEEWEKVVLHRDIKSSNVLLDSELKWRLGDFGLARLYEHNESPRTTRVVGTIGYIAPELIHTGKSTPSSDVFSFGVLLLEVACGRKPLDQSKDAEEMILTEWVWELYSKGRLLDAADPKLRKVYDVEQIERVLQLGLLCSHTDPERRPGMRHVCRVLEDEAPLPDLRPLWNNVIGIMGRSPISFFKYKADEIRVRVSSQRRSEGKLVESVEINSPSLEYDQCAIELCDPKYESFFFFKLGNLQWSDIPENQVNFRPLQGWI